MPSYDHGVSGLTGTIGVTVTYPDLTAYAARATAGITEPVAGSGVYHYDHPAAGTLLLFIFDGGVGKVGASCFDDGLQGASATALATVDTVVDAVKAKTDNLPAAPAATGDAMTLTAAYDHAKDDVLTPLAVVDANVDAILVDTDTTIPGLLTTIDTVVDDILVDTGTTLPATLTTIEGKVDTVDTVADAILVDTGTTLPATLTTIEGKVDTVDTVVDAILVDTGTDIPAALTTIDTVVDAVLVDTGTTIPDAIAEVLAAIPDIPPPDTGTTITQDTLSTGDEAIGQVMPYGVITAYIGTVAHYQFTADADGDFSYVLPDGSTWTLIARRAGYKSMTAEVAT